MWANRTHKPNLLRPAILGFPLLITFTSGSYFPFRLPEVHWSRFNIWFSGGKRKPRLVAFAHFCGVNTSTVTDFESLMMPWSAELDRDGNNWLLRAALNWLWAKTPRHRPNVMTTSSGWVHRQACTHDSAYNRNHHCLRQGSLVPVQG